MPEGGAKAVEADGELSDSQKDNPRSLDGRLKSVRGAARHFGSRAEPGMTFWPTTARPHKRKAPPQLFVARLKLL